MINSLADLPNFSYDECDEIVTLLGNSDLDPLTSAKLADLVVNLSDRCRRVVVCGQMNYRLFNNAVQVKAVDEDDRRWRFLNSIAPSHSELVSCINSLYTNGEFLSEAEANSLKLAKS